MRNGNGILFSAIAVVVVFAGLLAYQQLSKRNDQIAMQGEEIAALRDAVSVRDNANAELQREIEASRKRVADATAESAFLREAIENMKPPVVVRDTLQTLMLSDFHVASSLQVAILESYMVRGQLPADNEAAGLPAPDRYRGKALMSATVRDGSIELVFNAKSGKEGGRIQLVPDVSHIDAMGMQWHCETRDYRNIERILPACTYKR